MCLDVPDRVMLRFGGFQRRNQFALIFAGVQDTVRQHSHLSCYAPHRTRRHNDMIWYNLEISFYWTWPRARANPDR